MIHHHNSHVRAVRFYAVLFLLVSAWVNIGQAQTIHRDDLQYFAGCFAPVTDSDGAVLRDEDRRPIYDMSRFVAWIADWRHPDNRAEMDRLMTEYSPRDGYGWFALDTAGQDGRIHYSGDFSGPSWYDYQQVYFMHDHSGSRFGPGCLAWWRLDGDSVVFEGGRVDYDFGKVKRVAVFPDLSFLIYVEGGDGDVDMYWRNFTFLRGESPGGPIPFHTEKYDWDDGMSEGIQLTVDAGLIRNPSYRATVVTSYFSYLWPEPRTYSPDSRLDSASVKVIDLWDMAKDHFGIDTTGVELHYHLPHRAPE